MKKISLTQKITNALTDYPKSTLLLGIIIFMLMGIGLKSFKADFGYRIWFRTTDPLLVKFDAFEERFGNDDNIIFVIHNKEGVFNPKTIQTLHQLTEESWLLPDVIRVDSLSNYQWTHAKEDDIIVEDFLSNGLESNNDYLIKRKEIALKHEVLPGYLINKEADITLVYSQIRPMIGSTPDYQKITTAARELAQKHIKENIDIKVLGAGPMNDSFREVTTDDLKIMMPLLVGLIIIYLAITFKNILGVLLPFGVIVTSIASTLGIAGHLGIKFNNILSMIPSILIAICIADTVHVLVIYIQYRKLGYDKKEATKLSLKKNLVPILLTSISTSIGFFSLIPTELVPISHLGYLAGFGSLFAFVLTLLIISPLLVMLPFKVKTDKNEFAKDSPLVIQKTWAISLVEYIEKYRKIILSTTLVSFILAIYIASLNSVNSNPFNYFSKSVPLRIANDFVLDKMGGSAGPEIVIDSGVSDGIKDPVFLNKMDKLQSWINSNPAVNKTISIIDILKQMNRSFHAEDQAYYKLPENKKSTAELLFLYTMSLPQGMDLNNRISLNNDATRLSVLWNILDSKTSLNQIAKIEEKAKDIGLNAYVTGKIPLYQRMNGYVVDTFFSSISMALVLVGILLIIVFKSFKIGLLSLIPNILPLSFGAALMTILGKHIDIGTALVTSVCIGIAVDDTIHFLANYIERIKSGENSRDAVINVLSTTGPALILTTAILVTGFGIFSFANFMPNVNFGILTALVLTTALATDLVILPAIILGNAKIFKK